jgi:hypothetical protein
VRFIRTPAGATLVSPPFVASLTAFYPPQLNQLDPSFIGSQTIVRTPALAAIGNATFNTAGTFSWVCPPGVTTVYVTAYGGAGAGGDHSGAIEGGGGGGGAFAARTAVPVTPGTTYTVVVGAHGTHAIPGSAGSASTFTGDSGVQVVAAGGNGGANTAGGAGGAAASSTGDSGLVQSGGAGGNGGGAFGGGGGASGNNAATGNSGAAGLSGGAGGAGANGGGSGGHGGQNVNITAGQSPGGGGGGGGSGDPGANGADGSVVITTGQIPASFISSPTVVYAAHTNPGTVVAPFIASVTVVYSAYLPAQVGVPFISSHTVVYVPSVPEINAPFLASQTRVFGVVSLFDPNWHGVGPGNGGEIFQIRLAPNGTSETATLAIGIAPGDLLVKLTGDGGFPAGEPFVVTVGSEVVYLFPLGGGNYSVRKRAMSNTTAAAHSAGATVTWGDSYDQAIVAGGDIAHSFTANINGTGSFIYPGWLVAFDSSQAYLAGSRYAIHVAQVVGVFDARAGSTGSNRLDGAQPSAIATPAAVTDHCPVGLTNPARIAADITIGDVALVRYTNPEATALDLGPRSVALQSWFGLKRVDDSDTDVTFTDPSPPDSGGHGAHVVDTIPGSGPYTSAINGEWDEPLPDVVGIAQATGAPTPNPAPYTTVTLPGADRFFTYGSPHYSEKGWPFGVLAVRQGNRRVPFWQSYDWHDFSYVYCGFGLDDTFAQIVVNRNGVSGDEPEVAIPGPQDISGPDAVWDDGTYFFAVSWYVAIFAGPYLVAGPTIGGTPPEFLPGPPVAIPIVTFPPGGPPIVTGPSPPPSPIVEGGSGGGIVPPPGGVLAWTKQGH